MKEIFAAGLAAAAMLAPQTAEMPEHRLKPARLVVDEYGVGLRKSAPQKGEWGSSVKTLRAGETAVAVCF